MTLRFVPLQFEPAPRPSMREIAAATAAAHGLTLADIFERTLRPAIAHPRQAAFHALHETGRFSLPKIGGFFDMHHTTILHGVRAHAKRIGEGA